MIPTFEEVQRISGNVSSPMLLQPWEARLMYDTISQLPPGALLIEVGAHHGRSSSLILQLAKAIGFLSFHIDPYCDNDGDGNGVENIAAGWTKRMKLIDHPFTLFCMKTEDAQWFLPGVIDCAYIDGCHTGEAVTIDLRVVAARVKSGGYLICHDYGLTCLAPNDPPEKYGERFPDVSQAIRDFTADGWEQVGIAETLAVWRRL